MKLLKKLQTNRRFLLVIICVAIALFLIPYLTIPGIILWWFYKKSKLSKRVKIITTGGVLSLFVILLTMGFIAYARDAVPHLSVTQPASLNTNIKTSQITIKGNYSPPDRKVWINGEEITAVNGKFETTFQLKEGKNKIDVEAGNWKRTDVYLSVNRELPDTEKTSIVTPVIKATIKIQPTQPIKQVTMPTSKPTAKPKAITPPPTVSYDNNGFPDNAKQVTVADIAKTPNKYNDGITNVVFTCKIISFARNNQGDAAGANCVDTNDYSSIVQVDIGNFDISKINVDDTVTIYGFVIGVGQGKNTFGGEVTEALISGMYINDTTSGYNNAK